MPHAATPPSPTRRTARTRRTKNDVEPTDTDRAASPNALIDLDKNSRDGTNASLRTASASSNHNNHNNGDATHDAAHHFKNAIQPGKRYRTPTHRQECQPQ